MIFATEIFPRPDFSLIGFFALANDECITKLHTALNENDDGEAKNARDPFLENVSKFQIWAYKLWVTVGLNEMDSFENDSFGWKRDMYGWDTCESEGQLGVCVV